jgi:hypothetical protein
VSTAAGRYRARRVVSPSLARPSPESLAAVLWRWKQRSRRRTEPCLRRGRRGGHPEFQVLRRKNARGMNFQNGQTRAAHAAQSTASIVSVSKGSHGDASQSAPWISGSRSASVRVKTGRFFGGLDFWGRSNHPDKSGTALSHWRCRVATPNARSAVPATTGRLRSSTRRSQPGCGSPPRASAGSPRRVPSPSPRRRRARRRSAC